jgi:hypothetical protein
MNVVELTEAARRDGRLRMPIRLLFIAGNLNGFQATAFMNREASSPEGSAQMSAG